MLDRRLGEGEGWVKVLGKAARDRQRGRKCIMGEAEGAGGDAGARRGGIELGPMAGTVPHSIDDGSHAA